MKREFKGRWMFLSTVVGIFLLSLNVQAQNQNTDTNTSTTYQSTTTTTSSGSSINDADQYDDDDNFSRARAGIKIGGNWSNLIVDDVNDTNGKFGIHAGVYAQLFSNEAFAIQPEVNYSMKGNKVDFNYGVIDAESKFNLHYLDIPVLAVFKLGEVAEIHAGAYWAYLLAANIDTDGDLGDDFDNLDRKNFDNWDYGLVGGLGFNLGSVQLGARYNYGLNEIARSRGAKNMLGSTKNSVAQIYLAFDLSGNDD